MTVDAFGGRYAFALDLIRQAGDLALGYFRRRDSLTIQSKGLQDMASEADVNTELLIRRALEERFPQDAFLGEETGMTDYAADQGIWVVDPIDGTQPFISGMSAWCVSIAYIQGGELRFGMVCAPARGELFAGGQGIPATLNGVALAPHPGKTIRDGLCCVGHAPRVTPDVFLPIFERFIRAGGMYFREGSGALALCYVASGQLLGYLEAHINSWDCLGGIAVCHAAGLKTNDFLSGEGLHKGNPIVAGNAVIYAELDAILRA